MDDLQGGTLALEHRYDLSKRAGEFALFSVYVGVQHPFERPIWVKVCAAPAEFRAPQLYDRLKRAVVHAAAFEHDRVPRIVDFGDFDTHIPFVVTERADGEVLQDLVSDQQTLPLERAVKVVRDVAEIVADAHEQGRIHGGIAPKWITVTHDGVLLEHFGLQPTMAEVRTMDGAILSDDLLWALPPEQFGDEAVPFGEASDVWALGALAYWMLSGMHPYFDDPTDTSDAVLRLRNKVAARPLHEFGVDDKVSAIIARALAAEPNDRFSCVADFIDALPAEAKKASEPKPPPSSAPPVPAPGPTAAYAEEPRPLGTALAVMAALVLLTNLGWLFFYTASDRGDDAVTTREVSPSILPVGVELRTEPAGASVLLRSQGDNAEFGDTPLTLDPKVGGGKLELRVRKRGFEDVDIDVETTSDSQDLVLHLKSLNRQTDPAEEAEDDDGPPIE